MKRVLRISTFVFAALCATGIVVKAAAPETGDVSVKPRIGVFAPRGEALENVSLLAGAQVDWQIDDTFGLRLGYERVKAGVSDGSSLTLSRIPIIITTPLRKRTPFKDLYMGFGVVATSSHYSDRHYPDVNKLGPAVLVGWQFAKRFNAELQYDVMKRYGRNYGGFSFCVTYDGF